MHAKQTATILFLLLAIAPLPINASDTKDAKMNIPFAYKSEIHMQGTAAYKSVQLNRDVYAKAAPNLRDLRIIDQNGEPVPYFLYDGHEESLLENIRFQASPIGQFEKNRALHIDFAIQTGQNEDVYANSIELHTQNDNFAKEITLLGSHDSHSWTPITSGMVYSVDTSKKTSIELASTVKYPYFRVIIPDNSENISIDALSAVYTKEMVQKRDFLDSFQPPLEISTQDRDTILRIPAADIQNIKIKKITLETGDMFKRPVSTAFMDTVLYNLKFQDILLQNTSLVMDGYVFTGGDSLEITIHNGDDAPLNINGATIVYECGRAVFKSEPGNTYSLAFGNPLLESPTYDISAYAGHVLRSGVDSVAFGDILYIPPEQQGIKTNDTLLLNTAIGAASLILILLIAKPAIIKKK